MDRQYNDQKIPKTVIRRLKDRQYKEQKILSTVIREGQDNTMTKRYQTQ